MCTLKIYCINAISVLQFSSFFIFIEHCSVQCLQMLYRNLIFAYRKRKREVPLKIEIVLAKIQPKKKISMNILYCIYML